MVVVRPVLFAGVVVLVTAAAAPAGPFYSINLTNASFQDTSPVVLSSSKDDSFARHGEGLAFSGGVLAARVLTSSGAVGQNNGLSSTFNADLGAKYDDIFIQGPATAGPIPVVLHLPFHAMFSQSYDRLNLNSGTIDLSTVTHVAQFNANLTSLNLSSSLGAFNALNLTDQDQLADTSFGATSSSGTPASILAGPSPGPPSVETQGPITIFHNIPLDTDGFLYLTTRIQSPLTAANPAGDGFHFDDTVALNGEMILSALAQPGVPLTLNLSMSLSSNAHGGGQLGASGEIEALHTFGVPQDGSLVFDLPEGFTANSVSLNIVDNRVPGAESAIPEPSGIILFLFGTTLLGFFAVRDRFKNLTNPIRLRR